MISGVAGWKKVRPNAADGVTNVFIILSTALANGRNVDVFINGDQVERATLR
jgi:peroxiredoxin family protein